MKIKHKDIVCYLILNESHKRSYIGYTVNLKRRLRQHKRIIKGGAKYTRRFKKCKLAMYIHGFESKRLAMSYEWHAKRRRLTLNCHSNMLIFEKYHPRMSTFLAPLLILKFKKIKSNLCVYLSKNMISNKRFTKFKELISEHYNIKVKPI